MILAEMKEEVCHGDFQGTLVEPVPPHGLIKVVVQVIPRPSIASFKVSLHLVPATLNVLGVGPSIRIHKVLGVVNCVVEESITRKVTKFIVGPPTVTVYDRSRPHMLCDKIN